MSVFSSFKNHFIFSQDSTSPSSLAFHDRSGARAQNLCESIHGSLFVRLTVRSITALYKSLHDLAQPCILLIYQNSNFFTVSFLVFSTLFLLLSHHVLEHFAFIIQLYLISFSAQSVTYMSFWF